MDNFTTQAKFLLSQNLGQLAEQKMPEATLALNTNKITARKNIIGITNAVKVLTLPHEMGELLTEFKRGSY